MVGHVIITQVTSEITGDDASPILLLPMFTVTNVVFLYRAWKIGWAPSSERLFIFKLSSFSVVLFWRAWPMDTPPIASMRLLLRSRTVSLGQRPLISLPMARPVPSPSLLWDKSVRKIIYCRSQNFRGKKFSYDKFSCWRMTPYHVNASSVH